MGAILRHYEIGDAVLRAALAGEDMLLICATPERIKRGHKALLDAARDGRLPAARIEESLHRIARMKAIAEEPIPLDLERFKTLSDEVSRLNDKLNYVYGGTVK
jgi:beta-N-acetylhexosaminidase